MVGISIHEALATMAESGDRPFLIEFVRSTGKDQGKIKKVHAYYGAPNPKDRMGRPRQPSNGNKARKAHLESGSVPITEVGTRRLLTPLISHIVSFNNKKVFH